jgi:hypothetical protein
LDSGINPKNIYGTIQLSGLVRPTNPLYDIEFDLPNVIGGEWDYLNHMSPDKNSYHDLLEAHIINIENIIEWNINNNIYNFKVFCGWDIFFEKELIQFNLNDRFNNINKDYFFRFEYKEKEDLIDFNCAGSKPILDKLFGIKPKYIVPAGKNGGMNEFVKEYCNENEYWYGAKNDPHLNTFGNWIWYIKFYRNLFESWGVLDSNNSIIKNEKIYNKLKKIFQINFDVFLDSYEFDFTKHEICIKKTAEYYKKYFI